eukprot:11409584-Alexandrium_andersonii.AAC.1
MQPKGSEALERARSGRSAVLSTRGCPLEVARVFGAACSPPGIESPLQGLESRRHVTGVESSRAAVRKGFLE